MIRASLESGLDDVVMDGNLQFNQPLVELCEQLVMEAGRNSRLALTQKYRLILSISVLFIIVRLMIWMKDCRFGW